MADTGRWLVGAVVAATLLTGCGATIPGQARAAGVPPTDRALLDAFVADSNRAGEAGPAEQLAFLRDTQADGSPFPPPRCFGTTTLETALVSRTLRPDPSWAPPATSPASGRPEGAVYVAAAAVTVRQGGIEVREDVGSKHFVIRNGRVSSYAPCSN